jgi:phosphate starvation-inducible protein PhoH and related proteins
LIEQVIALDNITLVDFLGVENDTVREIAAAFPTSKIVSRGNEIRIQGATPEVIKITELVNSLLLHYHKYGKVTKENVLIYLEGTDKPKNGNGTGHGSKPKNAEDTDKDVLVFGNGGLAIKPKTDNQKALVEACQKHDLVFALGPAGTGKTYISVALAVKALKNKEVKKIIITRPAVEAGENLGFLPGDLKEKIDPYLRPIYDALDDMIPPDKLKYYQDNRIVEIAPLAYMRGRTLNHAFILLDEAQNTTPMQIKMFLTRMGPESKVIITGDESQIDLPKKQKSGLVEAINILKDVPGIGMIRLQSIDVVRHKLVKRIIEAYDKFDHYEKEKELQEKLEKRK